jgi:hypothetical protein
MAVPTNTYTRYTANNNVREDLADFIARKDPEKTPIISSAGRGTATNTLHEWSRDALRAPNADNAAIDGDDASASAKTPPNRIGNYCQIFTDTVQVSGRAEKVDKAGMKSALAYNKAKMYKELMRDMEKMVVSSNVAVLGSGAAAAKAAGLGALIYTNANHGAGGSTVAHTSGVASVAPTAGTGRALTETIYKATLQTTYTNSGDVPKAAYFSPAHKVVASSFTGIAQIRTEVKGQSQATIVGAADVYVSDFGAISHVPHYMMAGGTNVYGLDLSEIKVSYLRPFQSTPLAKTGDSIKEQLIVDATLVVEAEKACFKIADLTGG